MSAAGGPAGAGAFAGDDLARLKLAAEEMAWMLGRGYPRRDILELVSAHHALAAAARVALDRSVCSEPQYRRRAAREMEAEDLARRPIAIDGLDLVRVCEAALGGRTLLAALDGSYSALDEPSGAVAVGPHTDAALALVGKALAKLKPSRVSFVLDRTAGAEALAARAKAALFAKAKGDVTVADDLVRELSTAPCVASTRADVLDACKSWYNLTRDVVEAVPGATILRLQ